MNSDISQKDLILILGILGFALTEHTGGDFSEARSSLVYIFRPLYFWENVKYQQLSSKNCLQKALLNDKISIIWLVATFKSIVHSKVNR